MCEIIGRKININGKRKGSTEGVNGSEFEQTT